MKKVILGISFAVLVLSSCEPSNQSDYYESENSLEVTDTEETIDFSEDSKLSSSIASQKPKNRIFKKQGDIDFEVKDVLSSTKKIETYVTQAGGYILKSNLNNPILDSETVILNTDSAQKIIKSKANAYIECKVPQNQLVFFLTALEKEIEILNYRNLEAQEMTLDFKLADLQTQSTDNINKKLNQSLNKGGNINDESKVIEKIEEQETHKNYAQYNKLKMKDEVKMAHFTLSLKGKESIQEIKIANLDKFESARNPFFYDLKHSLTQGYHLFLDFILFVSNIWIFIIVLILVIMIYKKRKIIRLEKS